MKDHGSRKSLIGKRLTGGRPTTRGVCKPKRTPVRTYQDIAREVAVLMKELEEMGNVPDSK